MYIVSETHVSIQDHHEVHFFYQSTYINVDIKLYTYTNQEKTQLMLKKKKSIKKKLLIQYLPSGLF